MDALEGLDKRVLTDAELAILYSIEPGADVTDAANVAAAIASAAAKNAPVDGDLLSLIDPAASNSLKKLDWLNAKSAINTYLLGLGYLRSVANPDGSYSIQLPDGSTLETVGAVYAWPGITISGVPTLPAANTMPPDTVVTLHKDNFVGFGVNPLGVKIEADPIANIWRPHGRQIIWSGFFGLRAAPTVSRLTAGRFDIGVDPVIPAGLLNYINARLTFLEQLFSTNVAATTGPSPAIYIGTDLATYTNNQTVVNNAINSANNVTSRPDILFRRETATSGITTRNIPRGGVGSSGGLMDVSGGTLNFASAQMITFGISAMGSATQVDMHGFEIIWEG